MEVQKPERADDDAKVASEGQPDERKGKQVSIDNVGDVGHIDKDGEDDDFDHTKDQADDCQNHPWHNQARVSLTKTMVNQKGCLFSYTSSSTLYTALWGS